MDLEERTRQFLAALSTGPADAIVAFLSPEAVFEVPGLLPPIGLAKVDAMLRRAYANKPPFRVTLLAMKTKRNVVFTGLRAEGDVPGGAGTMDGLAVIHWDRAGLVERIDVHVGEDAARRLRP